MIIFQADSVVKQFKSQLALDRVSMEVPEGSIYGLLGPNGAGKTTLIRIINQITAPDSGQVLFKGRNIARGDIRDIGYLPEERGLYKKMKVGEQAVYLARLKGLSKKEATDRLKDWFDKFEITGWWNKKVQELSKGMQQKIQFIVTILHEPSLLIFDEPFSGFDPINTEILKKEVLEQKKRGATIIFSTHNMGSVEELCDHITLINDGRTILQGEINSIREAYKSDTYSIEFEGDIEAVRKLTDHKYELLEHHSANGFEHIRVRLSETNDGNRLLSELIPLVRIRSFAELLPGMNDIFIRAVKSGRGSGPGADEGPGANAGTDSGADAGPGADKDAGNSEKPNKGDR